MKLKIKFTSSSYNFSSVQAISLQLRISPGLSYLASKLSSSLFALHGLGLGFLGESKGKNFERPRTLASISSFAD